MEVIDDIMDAVKALPRRKKVEYASFGSGSVILIVAIMLYVGGPGTRTLGGSLFVAGVVIAFLPYSLYIYFEDKRYDEMEAEFPSFLRNISESLKSGMSLPQAFQQATTTDYGRLDEPIQHAAHQLSWGVPFPEVMRRMARRIEGSGLIRRSIFIILQAYESGGNIAETLDAIAANAARIKEAEEEKKAVLKQQVYIIYAIQFLFIGIILALFLLLDNFVLGSPGGGLGFLGGGTQNFCAASVTRPICSLCPVFGLGGAGPAGFESICYYKSLFLLMIVIGGVLNGVVAGEIVEGRASAGVKHALLMGPVGVIVYLVALTTVFPAL